MRSQTRATKNELNIISKNNFVWNEIRTDAFEKASLVINDPWIVKILGEEDRCRSLKERERERERWWSLMSEEKVGKVGLKVVLDVVPSAKLMRGKRTGTRPLFDEFLRNEF